MLSYFPATGFLNACCTERSSISALSTGSGYCHQVAVGVFGGAAHGVQREDPRELFLEVMGSVRVLCPLVECSAELCRDRLELGLVFLHAKFEIAQAFTADTWVIVGCGLCERESLVEFSSRANLLSQYLGRLSLTSRIGKGDLVACAGVVRVPHQLSAYTLEFGPHGRELSLSLLENELEFTTGPFALSGLVLAACLLELQLQRLKKLVALDKLQLHTPMLGPHGRELSLPPLENELEFTTGPFALSGLVLAACLLELQLQRLKKLVALDKLQLHTPMLGPHGRELSLPPLENELEFTTGPFALSGLVLAACLLELQLQRLKKLVALDKLQLHTRTFGPMLLKRGLEFLCVRFAGACEFELECLEIGSCRRELRPVLVSSGELDPNAFELLCTLVECRAKGRDRPVWPSGFARDA